MGRPPNADGARTRQAILDAALRLFAKRGYFGTSLRDIATAVSIRESALYNYFESKDKLFEALILGERESHLDLLSTAVDDPIVDVRETLTRLCVLALENFEKPRQRQLFRILMSDGLRLAREGRINFLALMNRGKGRVHDVMRQLVRNGLLREADPQLLAIEFMGPLMLWRQLRAIGSHLPAIRNPQAFARHHVDQFLGGAAVRPARPGRRPGAKRAGAAGRARRVRVSSAITEGRSDR